MNTHPTEARDQAIIDNAEYYTLFVRRGPQKTWRDRADTLDEIESKAKDLLPIVGKKVLLYAVSAEGRSAFVRAVG